MKLGLLPAVNYSCATSGMDAQLTLFLSTSRVCFSVGLLNRCATRRAATVRVAPAKMAVAKNRGWPGLLGRPCCL